MRTNIITGIVALAGLVLFAVRFAHEPWPPHRIIGAGLILTALVLIGIARVQLGHAFSVEARAHHLVTTGLYSRIRNPIYVFGVLLFAAASVFLWSWIPFVMLLGLIPIQVRRARKEAEVLEAHFGEEYRMYRSKTWF
jgi:protein-S-isoprenylcysteine O-methyltransferase Ste14